MRRLTFVHQLLFMSQPYSQTRALLAITRASFKAIFAQPTAIVFSLAFPIIFILIFGAFGNDGPPIYKIAVSQDSDTTNAFYSALKNNRSIRLVHYHDTVSLNNDLDKGRITALITLKEITDSSQQPRYIISTKTTTASANTYEGFRHTLDYMKLDYEKRASGNKDELITVSPLEIKNVRAYRQIDFVLPGQLGFSILFSTLFGISFLFYGLREQLVLKRFYASPVNRVNILLGIGMSRLFFQLLNVIILILFGHFLLNFNLQHGVITVIEMVLMGVVMLFVLMGVALIFGSIAKSDTNIPILVNLFGFPQMLLSGTFFPIEVFPKWLQEFCKILPLTQFNDAMRKISFEGLHIWDCWKQLGILGIWMIVIYFILSRVLKWE